MKILMVWCVLLVMTFSDASAQTNETKKPVQAKHSMNTTGTETTLISNEKALWEAWKNGDAKPFEQWVTPDATMIGPDGQRTNNGAKAVTDVMTTCKISSAEISDFNVTWLNKDTALLT